ncbi:hypothetical protein FB451DRAFT_1258691 [Mycena latifolia]|nr:hypothetical protein FB451DRAFT_1258691 [Mycena latifolia]
MDAPADRYTGPFSSSLLPTPEQKHQLRDFLRSNSVPHGPSHFQSVIASSAVDLAGYDKAIEWFQQMLKTMTSEREALQDYSDGCRSVFAPVRRLPTEILGEIFSLCAPEPMPLFTFWTHQIPRNNMDRVAQSHLLRLAQVCSSWHTTVMGTPSLWATIDVDLCEVVQWRDISKIPKLLSLSFQRSANHPLTIHLRANHSISGPALELLAKHSARWQRVDLHISQIAFAYLSAAKGNLPLLERLEIGGTRLDTRDIFEAAPKLTEVTFSVLGSDLPKLPWSQLRKVTFEEINYMCDIDRVRNGLQVLRRCSRDCQVNIFDLELSDLPLPIPDPPAVHSNIPHFQLSLSDDNGPDHSRRALGEIMATLTLPSLERLLFQSALSGDPIFWPRDHFGAFALRSSFRDTLQYFTLHDMVMTDDALVECLSELRALLELYIEDVPSSVLGSTDNLLVTDNLLRQLIWTPEPACITPKLRFLRFTSLLTFSDSVLLDLVLSRSAPSQNQPFTLSMWWHPTTPDERDIDEVVAARMSELEQQGVLVWSYQPI